LKTHPTRVLVAPLNWGLGHATRCIPLIESLQKNSCEVIIAANGAAATLLKQAFPTLTFLTPPSAEIKYSRTGALFVWRLLLQIPQLLKQLREEKKWLQQQISDYQLQVIISDNRYGLYHPTARCVLVTHQLEIKSGLGSWIDGCINRFAFRYINQFDEIWIPDYQGPYAIAGELSNPKRLPKPPLRYLGLLNRFAKKQSVKNNTIPSRLLLMLSGPEPQRSLLEEKFKNELKQYPGAFTLLCGKPQQSNASLSSTAPNLELVYGARESAIYDYLDAADLLREIENAEIIICRSGYTSLMELLTLGKKLIVIPTPGQAEQEYLATYCMQKGFAYSVSQENFSLVKALRKAATFAYVPYHPPSSDLDQLIRNGLNL
jgi:predicted glycosyltransferase